MNETEFVHVVTQWLRAFTLVTCFYAAALVLAFALLHWWIYRQTKEDAPETRHPE